MADFSDADELRAEIENILRSGGNLGGDWFIADYDGFPGMACTLGENPSLSGLFELAELLEQHGPDLVQAAAEICDWDAANLDELRETITDRFQGTYSTVQDFAEQLAEDCGLLEQVPEQLRYYFDFEKYARDLELGGDIVQSRVNGDLFIFWSC